MRRFVLNTVQRKSTTVFATIDHASSDASVDALQPLGATPLPMESPNAKTFLAAQPYQTLAGPALSVTFETRPVVEFQSLDPLHPAVPGLYHHSLVDSLAEFCETPREMKRQYGREAAIVTEPLKDFWRRVGTLHTTYFTRHRVNPRVAPTPGGFVCTHPALGGVELLSSPHRPGGLLDVRSSLFDNRNQPLSTLVLTGSRDDPEGSGIVTRIITHDDVDSSIKNATRRSLFSKEQYGNHMQRHKTAAAAGGDEMSQRVYFTEARLIDSKEGSGCAMIASWISDVATVDNSQGGTSDEGVMRQESEHELAVAVPPWLVVAAVEAFGNTAIPTLRSQQNPNPRVEGEGWTTIAYHSTQDGDLVADVPADVVCGPLKWFDRYALPPWRHRIGLPQLCGEPCAVMHLEIRQLNVVVVHGVYYFTPTRVLRRSD